MTEKDLNETRESCCFVIDRNMVANNDKRFTWTDLASMLLDTSHGVYMEKVASSV